MGEVIPLDDPQNYRRVMRRIKGLLEEGTLIIGTHAREEMAKDGFDDTDVLNVIRTGMVRPNSHSQPKERWRYVVEGATIDAGKAACVIEVNGGLVVVTVFALK